MDIEHSIYKQADISEREWPYIEMHRPDGTETVQPLLREEHGRFYAEVDLDQSGVWW